jgi:thiosulfate/3-mercaptopyruvate sulfurtransferase
VYFLSEINHTKELGGSTMSVQRYSFILLFTILLVPSIAFGFLGNKYNYISASDLETRLASNQPTSVVDIQVEEEFRQHHINGAIPTYAYPVKSDSDRAKLDAAIEQVKDHTDPVVIVCPRGGGGAKRTYDYLLEQSISEERLLILEKGQAGWPYTVLTENK